MEIRRKMTAVVTITLFLICMIGVATPVKATPNTIHVYEGQSIQSALDLAIDGDTIVVHPGIYREFVNIGKHVALKGIKATIDQSQPGGYAISMNVGGISISGFTIKGDWLAVGAPGGEWSGGLITDNEIYANGYGVGINLQSNLVISNNVIHAGYPIYGFQKASDVIIRNNILYADVNPGSVGILMFSSKNSIITGNTIYANLKGIDLYPCEKAIISGNKIIAGWMGISILGTYSTICNNRISGDFWTGIYVGSLWNTDNDLYSHSNAVLANIIKGGNNLDTFGILLVEYTSKNLVALNKITGVETDILDKGTNLVIRNQ